MLIFHTNVSFHGGVDASDFGNVGEQKFECLTYGSTKSALWLSLSDSRRRRYPWRVRIFLWLIFSAQAFGAGLDHYAQLVVNDSRATPRDGVRVTYLGTNGYQFEFKGHALLVDPYFSRVDLLSVALGSRIQPNASRINDGLSHLASANQTDAILVTHGHFDHLLDVPAVMAKTRARLVASASSVDLARARRRFIRRRSKTRRRAANRSMEDSRVIRDTRSVVRQSAI